MKFVKRITVFFIMPMTMFACGFASSTAIMEFFYPGRAVGKKAAESQIVSMEESVQSAGTGNLSSVDSALGELLGDSSGSSLGDKASYETLSGEASPDEMASTGAMTSAGVGSGKKEPEAVEVSIKNQTSINADTSYIIQEYDRNTGELTEENIPVPETFVGMNRDLFTKTMDEFNTFPSLTELEKGFVGCQVISFSPAKVVVRKTYELAEMPEGFYLVNENNFVTVYYGDMQTVYMNTNIWLLNLPEGVQQEIIYIKFIEREEELFDFLEAYSS